MNKTFSIFHTRGGAGHVRGIQVAQYLDAKINPTSGYEDDICIYVKIIPPKNHPKHSYLDVVDSPNAVEYLKTHPEMGVIAISEVAKEYLSIVLKRDDIRLIPHHHCNYEGWIRPIRPVMTVGIIGSKTSFQYPIEKTRKMLEAMGLALLYDEDHWANYNNVPGPTGKDSREKVVNFYKGIDIQIVWRPIWQKSTTNLRSPLKLENAGAFGIPTVSYPEPSYMREWEGCFLQEVNIENFFKLVYHLKSAPSLYKEISDKALERSKQYHPNHIKELYLNL